MHTAALSKLDKRKVFVTQSDTFITFPPLGLHSLKVDIQAQQKKLKILLEWHQLQRLRPTAILIPMAQL